jgi:hypothetical protein
MGVERLPAAEIEEGRFSSLSPRALERDLRIKPDFKPGLLSLRLRLAEDDSRW